MYILLLVKSFNSLRETIENCNGVSGYPVLFYSEKHNCLLRYCRAINSVDSPICKNLFRLDFRDISGLDDIDELFSVWMFFIDLFNVLSSCDVDFLDEWSFSCIFCLCR